MTVSSITETDLAARVARIQESEPFNTTAASIEVANPQLLNEELGTTLEYFARVERSSQHDNQNLDVLVPNMEPVFHDFRYHAWGPQEAGHADLHDEVLRQIGREPLSINDEVSSSIQRIGRVAALSASAHRVLEIIYLGKGLLHETSVGPAYKIMRDKLERLGEASVAAVVDSVVIPQEGLHTGMYRLGLRYKWAQLSPREQLVARALSVATYDGVGATTPADRTHFGRAVVELSDNDDALIDKVMIPVDLAADKLLNLDVDSLEALQHERAGRFMLRLAMKKGVLAPGFASKKVYQRIAEAREQLAA